MTVNEINVSNPEGKLLWAALIEATITQHRDKSPDDTLAHFKKIWDNLGDAQPKPKESSHDLRERAEEYCLKMNRASYHITPLVELVAGFASEVAGEKDRRIDRLESDCGELSLTVRQKDQRISELEADVKRLNEIDFDSLKSNKDLPTKL